VNIHWITAEVKRDEIGYPVDENRRGTGAAFVSSRNDRLCAIRAVALLLLGAVRHANEYKLRVSVNGRPLKPNEVRARYGRPQNGTDNRSPQDVIDIIQGYEEAYERDDHAFLEMRYRVNGKQEQTWRWPQP
jgi:hypothetical protein